VVDVGDRGSGVPAERAEGVDAGCVRPVRERPVAVVPEQHVVGVGRHEQVRVAVAVEVAGDAAVPLHRDVRVRPLADVGEAPTADVLEERATRQPAVVAPERRVRIRVRVDDEEVEPAVVVEIDPAEAAAHHPVHVVRHAEGEVVLPEVQPDLLRDVREPDTVKALRDGVDERNERDRSTAPNVRDDPPLAVLLQFERFVQRGERGPAHDDRRHVLVRRHAHRPVEFGNGDHRPLPVAGLEVQADSIHAVLGHLDRAGCRGAHLPLQRVLLVSDGRLCERLRPACREGGGFGPEVGEDVCGDLPRRRRVQLAVDALRWEDRDLR
jgi:hypothetical protein